MGFYNAVHCIKFVVRSIVSPSVVPSVDFEFDRVDVWMFQQTSYFIVDTWNWLFRRHDASTWACNQYPWLSIVNYANWSRWGATHQRKWLRKQQNKCNMRLPAQPSTLPLRHVDVTPTIATPDRICRAVDMGTCWPHPTHKTVEMEKAWKCRVPAGLGLQVLIALPASKVRAMSMMNRQIALW